MFIAKYPEAFKVEREASLPAPLGINLIPVKQTLQRLFIISDSFILKFYDNAEHSHPSWNVGQRDRAFGTFPVNIDKTLYHMTFGDWVSVSNSLLGICFAGCAYGVPGSARKLRRL